MSLILATLIQLTPLPLRVFHDMVCPSWLEFYTVVCPVTFLFLLQINHPVGSNEITVLFF